MEFLPGGRFRLMNLPLLPLLGTAYNIPWQSMESIRLRMRGLPDWILSEPYDIEATAERAPASPGAQGKARNERIRLMLQSVLADRCKLKVRRDTEEIPVYSLEVEAHGPKMEKAKIAEQDCTESAPFAPISPSAPGCHQFQGGAGRPGFRGLAVDMSDLALYVSNWTDRPIVDDTGLAGLYAIQMDGWESSNEDSSRLTLDDVLDRLGLKLVRKRATVEILVIEHVERPSEN